MPQLPQDTDYGRRPSLDVNRLDRPATGGAELADTALQAVASFQAVMDQNIAKENALNYSLARNEAQQLDIEERLKLSEDLDWSTHGERYETSYRAGLEKIRQKYNLTARDAQIFDSETDMIHANGNVQVAGRARVLEVKEAHGRYLKQRAEAKELITIADEGSRNRLMLGQLDNIQQMVDLGFMDEDEGAAEAEKMTQEFATASLDYMDAGPRARVIEKSLRYRRGYGTELGEYADSFMQAAEATGVPVELLHAVASRESALDPSAVNKDSGAAGLMQLKQGTAGDVGVTDRLDPDQSIRGGAQYLAEQMERFGDPEKALAAYNWGPKNVQEAIDKYGDDWLSHAPEETRKYVAALTDEWVTGGDKGVQTKGKFDTGSGPLTPDDIRNGLGTDSIADFLHADTAAKMLEIARKEDKTNLQRTEAQGVVNRVFDTFPESHEKRMKMIDEISSGTVQNLAEEDARQQNQDEQNAKLQASQDLHDDYSSQMLNDGLRYKSIPTDDLKEMLPHHQIALEKLSNARSYGEMYPAVTQRFDLGDGSMSQEEWNNMPNYGRGGKTDQNLDTALFQTAFTEQDINAMRREQEILRGLEGKLITTGELTPKSMVTNALNAMQFKVDDDSDNENLNGIKARLEGELRQRILQKQNSTTPPQELDEQARNKILAEILAPMAFTDTDLWWFDSDYDADEAVPVWLMTGAQREEAFIDLDKANRQTMIYEGVELNVEQILRKIGVENGIMEPSKHNLRRAAFAFMNRIGTDDQTNMAEVVRRLEGK